MHGRPQEGGRAGQQGLGTHRAREEESTAQPISRGQGERRHWGAGGPRPRQAGWVPGSQEQALAWEPGQERAPPGPEGMGCGWEHGGTPGPIPVSGSRAPARQWATWDGCCGERAWARGSRPQSGHRRSAASRRKRRQLPRSWDRPASCLRPRRQPAAPSPGGGGGPRPRAAVGCWPGENGSQPSGWGGGNTDLPRPGSSGPAGFPRERWEVVPVSTLRVAMGS